MFKEKQICTAHALHLIPSDMHHEDGMNEDANDDLTALLGRPWE